MRPTKPTNKEGWLVLAGLSIAGLAVIGGVLMFFSLRVPAEKAVIADTLRQIGYGFFGLAGLGIAVSWWLRE